MKALAVVFVGGFLMVAGSTAIAGRDESQMMQVQQMTKAMKARQLAEARQAQSGLAGPTGEPGKVGPGEPRLQPARAPGTHP
jgi:hypothetical protein